MRIKKILTLVTVILVITSITLVLFNCQSASATKTKQKWIHPTGVDISKHVKLVLYMVGDKPADMEKVMIKANKEYFEPKLNTTVEIRFIPWAELQNKYSLILAGGEQCDIIYTATWCYYYQEASKGAFRELKMDWIKKYMPQTYKTQAPESWDQIAIKGRIYAVPRNYAGTSNYKYIAIRGDLREKYKLPKVESLSTLEKYLFTIAKNERNIQAIPAAGNNFEFREIIAKQMNKIWTVTEGYDFYYKMNNASRVPSSSEIFYLFTSPYFKDFAKRMAVWASHGVWSRNAISNAISPGEAFANGRGAAIAWNSTLFVYGKRVEEAKIGKVEYCDITPDVKFRRTSYAGDAFAITRKCQYPERAGLVLDLMKNDKELNLLLIGGIKGVHWIEKPNNMRAKGPAADKYGWNCWAWALQGPNLPKDVGIDPRQQQIESNLEKRAIKTPIDGFVFDETPVKAELAVINSLRDEYIPSFELGMFGNKTEEKFNEFVNKLQKAGLNKVLMEFRKQFEEYKKRKGI